MSYLHVSAMLTDIAQHERIYLFFRPDPLDFTSSEGKGEMVVCCPGQLSYTFSMDKENVLVLWSMFQFSIFAAGKKVIGWNLKTLFSYLRHFGKRDFVPEGSIVDLKVMESYLGVTQPRPADFTEAIGRVRHILNSAAWKDIQPVYRRIYLPLIQTVLPALETGGLLDKRLDAVVHAHYHMDGKNGRLKTDKSFAMSFLPHSMGEQDRESLMPRHLDELFLYFDFRHLEVAVLQWLSGDEKLGKAMDTPDVYSTIFESVTGNKCESHQREMAKKFFLAVIYGQSPGGLLDDFAGQGVNISLGTATSIVNRVNDIYSTASEWISGCQDKAESSHVARDYYGRRREFPDSAYLVRNFKVQAPASTICLDKLIQLQRSIPVVMHIHDGYIVTATKKTLAGVYSAAKATLEAEDDFYPGLKLRINCKAGRNLNRLKPIGKKGTE